MADIFSEVDEDVRKDKSLALWNAYGKYVIAAAVLLVVATAAYVGWQNYVQGQSEAQGAEFEAAAKLMGEKKFGEASAAFAGLAESGNAGYRPLASLREAAALIEAGEGADALEVYDRLAKDNSIDPEFSSLADLLAGYYLLNNGSTADVRAHVEKLAAPGGIWSATANELLALTYIKDGDTAKAKEILTSLKDDAGVSQDIKSRVSQLLAALGGE
ncbi:MAG: tetratricopeptide repeat protein [Sneathiella sp.]|nr:tetratricopeptide repeat protein [Sneathiella sp.]